MKQLLISAATPVLFCLFCIAFPAIGSTLSVFSWSRHCTSRVMSSSTVKRRRLPYSPGHRSEKLLTPSNVFTNEKIRGAMTSVFSGGVSGTLNVLGVTVLGLSAPLSAVLMLYLFGSVFGYTMDILFAKSNFCIPQGYNGKKPYQGHVSYIDFAARGMWLLRSFINKHFFRFVITVIIDTLIGLSLLHALTKYADDNNILTDFQYRNMFIAAAVSITTFFLFTNVLRFDWAYSDVESPLMDVVVLMWVAIVILVYAVTYSERTTLQNKSDAFFTAINKNSSSSNLGFLSSTSNSSSNSKNSSGGKKTQAQHNQKHHHHGGSESDKQPGSTTQPAPAPASLFAYRSDADETPRNFASTGFSTPSGPSTSVAQSSPRSSKGSTPPSASSHSPPSSSSSS